MKNKKAVVMLSGGLDSKLALRIMQEQGFDVIALYFNLPFETGCCNEKSSFNFLQISGIRIKIFDCSKGKLLQEYLDVIRHPKYGRGKGINPCIDCRIFMFKKAKEFADKEKIDLIVSGEVLNERPMSQHKKAMEIIRRESGLKGRLLRPLSAKLLEPAEAEKKGIVNRNKLYSIQGRSRKKQIKLAKKFKISYPNPAGGCLLCEKALKKRFEFLLKREMNEKEVKLVGIGRHFLIDKCWIVLGRDEKENKVIEKLKIGEKIIPKTPGPTAIILDKCRKETLEKIKKLIKAYSKGVDLKERKKFEKYLLK
ncbi:hypothetical protein DRN73_06415 [Candidatus Pacearchaeota archaeon]|nr:MAG: hypothetical protein DRN73_06415 [Candidatus Pacearchaeota archaeon]